MTALVISRSASKSLANGSECVERFRTTLLRNAPPAKVQPLGPPKSASGKLATIFKLTHYDVFELASRGSRNPGQSPGFL